VHAPYARIAQVVRAWILVLARSLSLALAVRLEPAADDVIVERAGIVIVAGVPLHRSVLAAVRERAGVDRASIPVIAAHGLQHARAGRRIAGVHVANVAAATDPGCSLAGNRSGWILRARIADGAGQAVVARAAGGPRDTETGAGPVTRVSRRARVQVVARNPGRLVHPHAPGAPVAGVARGARGLVVAGRPRWKRGRHAAGRRVATVQGAGISIIAIQGIVPTDPAGRVARIESAGIVVVAIGADHSRRDRLRRNQLPVKRGRRDKADQASQQNRKSLSHVGPPGIFLRRRAAMTQCATDRGGPSIGEVLLYVIESAESFVGKLPTEMERVRMARALPAPGGAGLSRRRGTEKRHAVSATAMRARRIPHPRVKP
jgi:hypothetical protein